MISNDLFSLLITQTWQVTLLIMIVWLIARLWTKDRPHLAHALWALVLIKCLTPPVFSSPTSAFSWLSVESRPEIHHDTELDSTISPASEPPQPVYESPTPTIVVQAVPQNDLAKPGTAFNPLPVARSTPAASIGNNPAMARDWAGITIWLWIVGMAVGALWTSIRFACFLRWIRISHTVQDPSVERWVGELREQLGIRRRVRLRILDSPVGPAVLGWFRPTVLLPSAMTAGQSRETLEPLLAHELIHIRRGDLGWALLQTIARCLFWFHPLVRLATQMVTRESERSCDEETVASLGCQPAVYANGLLQVLEHKNRLRVAPALPGVRPVDITSARLERVMKLGNGIHRRTPLWVWLIMFVGCVIVLPGAAMVLAQDRLPTLPAPESVQPSPQEQLHSERSLDKPRKALTEANWYLQTYEIPDVIEQYSSTNLAESRLGKTPDDLLGILGCRHPGPNGFSTPEGRELQFAVDTGIITLGNNHPTMHLAGDQLYVFGSDRIHQEVSRTIEKFRRFGFREICVETRVLRTSVDQLDKLGVDWSMAPAARVVLDPGDPRPQHTGPKNVDPLVNNGELAEPISSQQARKIATQSDDGGIAATSYVEKNSPVLYATIDDQGMTGILNAEKSDARTTLLQAPTVTMFNGQTASVVTGTQRPFVVGLEKLADKTGQKVALQPVIRVINEGMVLNINAEIVDDSNVKLDCQLEQSRILSVETLNVPGREEHTNQPAIQIPEVATTCVQSSLDVPNGMTLVLSSIQRDTEGESQLFVALLTCRILDMGTAMKPASPTHLPEKAHGDSDRVTPGDILGLSIEGVMGNVSQSEPSNDIGIPTPVKPDGTISLPLIEPIKVEGLKPPKIGELIANAYIKGDEPILDDPPKVCVGIVSRANGEKPSDEALSAAPKNIITGKQKVGELDGKPVYSPEITPIENASQKLPSARTCSEDGHPRRESGQKSKFRSFP